VTLKTLSGDVRSELPADIIKAGRRNWQGRINGGGADVEMNSVSGDLRISRGAFGEATPPGSWPAAGGRESDHPSVAEPTAPEPSESDTVAILGALERGEITVEEAMARLDNLT
jgi:hypothetical protein